MTRQHPWRRDVALRNTCESLRLLQVKLAKWYDEPSFSCVRAVEGVRFVQTTTATLSGLFSRSAQIQRKGPSGTLIGLQVNSPLLVTPRTAEESSLSCIFRLFRVLQSCNRVIVQSRANKQHEIGMWMSLLRPGI